MIKGAIVYDKAGEARNQWFIQQFISLAHNYDLELKLYLHTDEKKTLSTLLADNVQFVIMRTISPSLSLLLENSGIKVFNNSLTSKIANDKYKTFELMRSLDIPVMGTILLDKTKIDSLNLSFPLILKSVDGHGGSQVYMVNDKNQIKKAINDNDDCAYILQRVCSDPGKDMRIYLLGDKILACVLRQAKSGFKSNFSLGGSVSLSTAQNYQIQMVQKIKNQLSPDFIGIDFIYHDGRWILNEIEDVVGTRMLYQLTDIDVVKTYLEYVKRFYS